MNIKPCPKCGRTPKIFECNRNGKQQRTRIIWCPNHCDVISQGGKRLKAGWIRYVGDGDDNAIYKIWNDRVS